MDLCSIKAEKFTAMNNKMRAHHFLYNLVIYTLTSLITCLFFSYPFWFPSIKSFLFSFSNINPSIFFNAKSLFILGNIIVFILVGESKFSRSPRSSPAMEIYDEYVARSRRSHVKVKAKNVILLEKEEEKGIAQSPKVEGKKIHENEDNACREERKKEMGVCRSMHRHAEKPKVLRASKSEVWGESEIAKRNRTKGKEVEDVPSHEELNKRVNAFIAKVNKQRSLEAKLFDCSRG